LLLHLPLLPEDGPANAALGRVLVGTARAHYAAAQESRALLTGKTSAEAYLAAAMTAKKRKELRRQHNRLAEEGALAFERLEGEKGLAVWTAEFLSLEAAGWGAKPAPHSPARPPRKRCLPRHWPERRKRDVSNGWRSGSMAAPSPCSPTSSPRPAPSASRPPSTRTMRAFSPGMLLQLENLALLERPEVEWADSCVAEGHPMIERLWRGHRRMVSRNIAIGRPARRALFRLLMAWETRKRSPS